MPSGTVIHSGPLPKPRAAKAKSSPVAIEKPSGFSSSICSTSPPMIQSIGPGLSASRGGRPWRNAIRKCPTASTARKPDIT